METFSHFLSKPSNKISHFPTKNIKWTQKRLWKTGSPTFFLILYGSIWNVFSSRQNPRVNMVKSCSLWLFSQFSNIATEGSSFLSCWKFLQNSRIFSATLTKKIHPTAATQFQNEGNTAPINMWVLKPANMIENAQKHREIPNPNFVQNKTWLAWCLKYF